MKYKGKVYELKQALESGIACSNCAFNTNYNGAEFKTVIPLNSQIIE